MSYTPDPNNLTVKEALPYLGVTYACFLKWERQGLTPRRFAQAPGRLQRIPLGELKAWCAQREIDRVASAKPWLRKPLRPLSWIEKAPQEAAQAVAQAVGVNHAA